MPPSTIIGLYSLTISDHFVLIIIKALLKNMAKIHSSKYGVVCLLLSSMVLNGYLMLNLYKSNSKWELSWSTSAAAEAEAVAALTCSGHGRAYLDGLIVDGRPICECYACFGGPDCSDFLPGCPADVDR